MQTQLRFGGIHWHRTEGAGTAHGIYRSITLKVTDDENKKTFADLLTAPGGDTIEIDLDPKRPELLGIGYDASPTGLQTMSKSMFELVKKLVPALEPKEGESEEHLAGVKAILEDGIKAFEAQIKKWQAYS